LEELNLLFIIKELIQNEKDFQIIGICMEIQSHLVITGKNYRQKKTTNSISKESVVF
tara:strand:- start:78922 stop:79092 length:171 start_codon:yes stop_codon:yes gene_type:complete